jgi:hypothetical protein
VSRLSRQCGILNISQPYRPPQPGAGIAILFSIVWIREGSPLRSSGQRSWLQIEKLGFDSHCYQIFWEVVGLERGPFSLMSTIKELLERKSSGSGLEIREYGRRDPLRWPHITLYPLMLALTSLTSSGRSVGIVRSWTQAKGVKAFTAVKIEFFICFGASF